MLNEATPKAENIPLYNQREGAKVTDIGEFKASLQTFTDKLIAGKDNIQLRDDQPLNPNDAALNIESLINYNYAKTDVQFETLDKTEFKIPLTKTGGMVNNQSLYDAYYKTWQGMSSHYLSVSSNQKNVLMVDVKLEPNNTLVDTLVVNSYIAKDISTEQNVSSSPSAIFDLNGIWNWTQWGACTSANMGDATVKLTKEINQRYPIPGGRELMYNIDAVHITPFAGNSCINLLNVDDEFPNDNHMDNLLYHISEANPNFEEAQCITALEMYFYYGALYDKIIPACQPSSKIFSHIGIKHEILACCDIPVQFVHEATINYGNTIYCPCGENATNPSSFCINCTCC
ncbi:MAG: hypothetical protein WAS72_03160 [Saprospiraceae bacterium]